MVDTILVAVTGAPVAERTVRWAAQRAAGSPPGAVRLELVSVVGGALGTVGEASVLEQAIRETGVLLERLAGPVRADGLDVATRVEAGNPVARLIDASADAELLVIGSDYRGTGDGPARGTHGIRIAAGAACPVVVVPDLELVGRRGIVVGIDGSPVSERALRFAAREADRLGEPLIAVSVWTPLEVPRNGMAVYPEMYLVNMQSATEELQALALAGLAVDLPDLVMERVVERGYPSRVIASRAMTARMVVVGTHGRGALARFLLGSISQEVLARLTSVTAVVR
ncbi:universal stress protein [Microbacterium sp. VKM Ac-2870]|uniref:universal stress protein n=1 Tax=Microbacterium sp. VKM Ac-2870 TaxID=2783825 RepID=UPI00188B9086|nr:universal stress protein [Microbacterium sp. VKM Ac-2870]MBF4561431.1 universal stress protein [Microbacterium sp. VKM Ac-2870]